MCYICVTHTQIYIYVCVCVCVLLKIYMKKKTHNLFKLLIFLLLSFQKLYQCEIKFQITNIYKSIVMLLQKQVVRRIIKQRLFP